jgi:hypothetical protein
MPKHLGIKGKGVAFLVPVRPDTGHGDANGLIAANLRVRNPLLLLKTARRAGIARVGGLLRIHTRRP